MSMRVEKSSLEEVQAKFEAHKRRREEEQQAAPPSFEARVQAAVEEEEQVRQQRRERKLEKKKAEKQLQLEAGPGDEGGMDPEMAAMMGFSGFAGR